jgi:predicted esterase
MSIGVVEPELSCEVIITKSSLFSSTSRGSRVSLRRRLQLAPILKDFYPFRAPRGNAKRYLKAHSQKMNAVVVSPTCGIKHEFTFIFLHGFGMRAADTATSLAGVLATSPGVRFVFPQAPTIPITAYAGLRMPSWYDYLTDHEGKKEDALSMRTLQTTRAALQRLVWKELKAGVPVCIGGESQGGCVALDFASQKSGDMLAGVITCVAHRLFVSSMHPLNCPWYALTANDDEVFPKTWAKTEGAFAHTEAKGGHHLTDAVRSEFVSSELKKLQCLP